MKLNLCCMYCIKRPSDQSSHERDDLCSSPCLCCSKMFLRQVVQSGVHGFKNVSGRGGQVFSAAAARKQHSQAEQQGSAVTSIRPETSTAKTLMDIGTRRIFNEDHDIFRQSVRRFFQEEVVPHQRSKWLQEPDVMREVFLPLTSCLCSQVGKGRRGEQGVVGKGWRARPAGSDDPGGTRRHRRGHVFCCYNLGGAMKAEGV
ncbi:uncharacterized protein LOC122827502 [Gambusia affinis]|uniref:uncharacterized protein LOC122827502 n=1 Tax=Gambusia affinis TaxID=33528 RepID=UPI001CDCE319|nr:uncharacterized protein LOC122827502 [Gambusia affinis]